MANDSECIYNSAADHYVGLRTVMLLKLNITPFSETKNSPTSSLPRTLMI